jgi:hypothetical protein
MNDLLVVLMTVGFFAVCIAYVALCDRIVGPDEDDLETEPDAGAGATAVAVSPEAAR